MKTYRVGVAAMVHDHVWGELRRWQEIANVELVAAGDVNPELRERITRDYGVKTVYTSWQEMLAAEADKLDIVQIASENNVHADIVDVCSKHGLHVISEKPMSATLAQAERIAKAVESSGIKMLINWPTAWMPAFQEMERRILGGEIGQVRYFKYRSAHNGPKEIGCDPRFYEWLYDAEKNGAGALMDYCCYGAAMAALFLGRPEKVTGLRGVLIKDYPLPDDNAIITMQFKHAMAVAEASWTQTTGYVHANPIAYGSEGAISLQNGKVNLLKPGKEAVVIEPAPLAAPLRSGPEYLMHCIENDIPVTGVCSVANGRIAQEILEAGLRAADTGNTQNLPISIVR